MRTQPKNIFIKKKKIDFNIVVFFTPELLWLANPNQGKSLFTILIN